MHLRAVHAQVSKQGQCGNKFCPAGTRMDGSGSTPVALSPAASTEALLARVIDLTERVLHLETLRWGQQRHLDSLQSNYNRLNNRLCAQERESLRIDRLERELRQVRRANRLLLEALQEASLNYQLLSHRVGNLELAGL